MLRWTKGRYAGKVRRSRFSLVAAEIPEAEGVDVEVIEVRRLDSETIGASVRKNRGHD